jgi:benzylsuccinate CoA-transferase BbsF subunit
VTRAAPLAGLKVLDFCWVMAGPMIGRVLSDFGATVVRVESSRRPDLARSLGPFQDDQPGIENSIFFSDANAGKLDVALDMTAPEARAVARDLAAWSDVVIESFSPGVMDRWGLGYSELSAEHPELIMLSTSLFGAGPYGSVAGFGSAGGALSGIHYLTGWPDRPAQGFAGPYSDAVNPRFGAMLILAALDRRRRTRAGTAIDLSQIEATLQMLAPLVAAYSASGEIAERRGNRAPGRAPHGVYRCRADAERSEWVAISVRDDGEWQRLCDAIERPQLAAASAGYESLADRSERADELDAILEDWTLGRTASEIETLLQGRAVPAHVVANEHDLANDPQLLGRGHFIRFERPGATATAVESSRIALSATPAQVAGPGPAIGEHTEHVLGSLLGYSTQRVQRLREEDLLR